MKIRTFLVLAWMAACGCLQAQVERTRVPVGTGECAVLLPSDIAGSYRFDSWTGSCLDGLAHGRGTLTGRWLRPNAQPAAYVFEGTYVRGLRNGYGRRTVGEIEFAGTYRNDKPEGWGRERNEDGSTFEGQFFDGRRNGIGELVRADGWVTRGRWVEGRIVGAWLRQRANGTAFLIDERPDGTASALLDASGEVGAGRYRLVDGKWLRDGQGLYRFQRGQLYLGNFARDLPNGDGLFVAPDRANPADARLYGGSFRDGCIGEGNASVNVIVSADSCRRR